MFYIEWMGGELYTYLKKENWERAIADLIKKGFHKDWDFYCYEF